MKKVSLLMLSLCLLVSACKDKNAPKSPEEVKEAAFEVVQSFIEDIYNDDIDVDDYCSTIFLIGTDMDIVHEFPTPYKISEAAREAGVKLDPAKVSFNKELKEINEKGKLKYVLVEIKYEGHKYGFLVFFNGEGKTGTEGEARIFSTKGLVPFDNTKYAEKTGFTLEYSDEYNDMTPYVLLASAVESSRDVKNKKKVSPQTVTIKGDWEKGEAYFEILCSDSVVYIVKDNRITKSSKK